MRHIAFFVLLAITLRSSWASLNYLESSRVIGGDHACADGWEGESCDVPVGCMHQTALDATCEYYQRCLFSQRQCPDVQDIMGAKCVEYHDLAMQLSPTGQQWAANVTSCIQNKLSDIVLLLHGSNYSCATLNKVFFTEHVDCYLHASEHSFCTLPLWDRVRVVVAGADMILLPSSFWPTIVSAGELFWACTAGYAAGTKAGEL
jgi:hypothetical protein